MWDAHVHKMRQGTDVKEFISRLKLAGIDGSVVISCSPSSFQHSPEGSDWQNRLSDIVEWCSGENSLYPFFWIDPIEEDALNQVQKAMESGIAGFKIICNSFYPSDSRAMDVYRAISDTGKPLLFHSGILWDGQDSARYNRPGEFECLLGIKKLRFALAHVSWPWCDECLAVFGKFLNAKSNNPDISSEMFIDVTPGTPPIYRKEVLTKIFTIGYNIKSNVIFGSDCLADDYGYEYAREWADRDKQIYGELGLDTETVEKVFRGNLKRFLGI